MEPVWVLMYTVVTWANVSLGQKRYEPRFQRMPSEAVCISSKLELKQMATRERMFEAIRCEELMLPIEE